LFIGHYAGCPGLDFRGAVDEPRIWSRALAAGEVATIMQYSFQGFLGPTSKMMSGASIVAAGRAVPIIFTLGVDEGLGILASGYPASHQVNCTTLAPLGPSTPASASGASAPSYDAPTRDYTYVWKTDKSWANTCRQMDLSLNDGSTHSGVFRFGSVASAADARHRTGKSHSRKHQSRNHR
jgi:hypothetical protein